MSRSDALSVGHTKKAADKDRTLSAAHDDDNTYTKN
jgi:hypothetical protein